MLQIQNKFAVLNSSVINMSSVMAQKNLCCGKLSACLWKDKNPKITEMTSLRLGLIFIISLSVVCFVPMGEASNR